MVGVVVMADTILTENNNYSMKTYTGDMHVYESQQIFFFSFFNSVTHLENIDPVI